MNLRRLACLLPALAVLPPLAAAPKEHAVIDFTYMERGDNGQRERSYEYAFGDWNDRNVVQVEGKGLIVNRAGSKGGVGQNRDPGFDRATGARIVYVIGSGNQAKEFHFSLVDHDGSDHFFTIPLAGAPRGQVLGALVEFAKPGGIEAPGKKPGLDLNHIDTWQIKGDFQDLPLEVLVIKVLAVRG